MQRGAAKFLRIAEMISSGKEYGQCTLIRIDEMNA
jgi:hypothetical protein